MQTLYTGVDLNLLYCLLGNIIYLGGYYTLIYIIYRPKQRARAVGYSVL